MCTPQGIIEKIGCLICDEAVKKAIKAATYVRHYKANLENLEAEMRTLKDRWEIIERKVQEAKDRGEEVEAPVSHWLTDVDGMEGCIQELVGRRTAEQNMRCFVCSCPNIKWRYRLGKLAEARTEAVKKLTQDSHFDEISHSKPPPPELEFPSNENFVIFDSRTPILKTIMEALNDPKVNKIGVHGLGGVGKTRLVEEVRKQMRENGTFKQAPLAVVSKNPNVKDIQSKLAGELDFPLDTAANDKIRACRLWHKFLNGERYLVILDDIWQKVDLNEIGIPITNGKTGCKVVLTSRNERLLKEMEVDRIFQIDELSELEAWALFKKKVGDSADSPELYPLASKVCQKCKGLPVAINALGAALKDKPLHAWQSALNKLERYMLTYIEDIDPSVFASLRVSYDMLHSEDAKSCFLICCLFPEDAHIPIDDLMRHCVGGRWLAQTPRTMDEARNDVYTVVGTLKSCSLLSYGRDENIVKIHDVIRDIGIKIARDEKVFLVDDGIRQWPETSDNGPPCSVISIRSGNINQLPDELTYPQLHTLIFEYRNNACLKVPDRFFSGMKKLTVLAFNGMCLFPLPPSLPKLPNLRMLCLNNCQLGDIKILGDLKTKLELLSLRGSNIKALPSEIGQLIGLRLLDLRDCIYLAVIPHGVISNLTNLEELYIPDSFKKWKASTDKKQDTGSNVSLDELSSLNDQLTTLHIHIPDVKLLPEKQLKFENLKRFKISVGSMFEYNDFFSTTSILKLESISLKDEFTSLMEKAEEVYLRRLEGLKKVLAKPKSVSFSNLSVLVIQSCGNLIYLFSPSCARGLLQLEQLKIKSCPMEEIVGFDGEDDEDELMVCFSKLKVMALENLPNLISFYPKKDKTTSTDRKFSPHSQSLFNEKVIFPVLEILTISRLPNITEIWDMQLLSVQDKAESSERENAKEEVTNDDIFVFSQLRSLYITNMENLKSFCTNSKISEAHPLFNHQVIFPVLKILDIGGLPNITEIWDMLLLSVQDKAESSERENAKEEVANDDIFVFSQLQSLYITNMENLKSFCTNSKISEAHPLFNHQVAFPSLQKLTIKDVPNITEIWYNQPLLDPQNKTESFYKLSYIKITNCGDLVNVFPYYMLSQFQINLKNLVITSCPKVEVIVSKKAKEKEVATKDIIVFQELTSLRLEGLENLKSFSAGAELFFDNEDTFPVLEGICLDENLKKLFFKGTYSEEECSSKGEEAEDHFSNID